MSIDQQEQEELLERRLTEKVASSVESTLKWRYAWIAAVVLGVYGIGGWTIVRDMAKTEINEQVSEIMEKQVIPVQEKTERLHVTAEVARNEIDLIKKRATDAFEEVERLNEQTLQLSRQLKNQLKTINDQIGSLGARLRPAEEVTLQFEEAQQEIDALKKTVVALTEATQKVAKQANVKLAAVPIPPEPSAAARPSTTVTKTTIYFQYSGTLSREQAKIIAEELKSLGYSIPGIEQASSTVQEVRFFYAEDQKAANSLASLADEILKRAGLSPSDVRSKNLTSWPRAKPPQGTLELWLNIE